jgi:ribosome biogenesis SPOUT family RNA methylase Rps3
MDMRGKEELKPKDHFHYVVLAGIVGDHPPQDRAAELRCSFPHLRNLGSV